MQTVRRLAHHYTPSHYQLTLEIDAEQRIFTGVVAIDGQLRKAAAEVRLHGAGLTLHAASINSDDASAVAEGDELIVSLGSMLSAGPTRLELSFSGHITDALHGIYSSTFEHDGTAHSLITTQFESHHAREAFPCIDEPEAKATIDLTLVTAPGMTVLGNMPVRGSQEANGRLTTTFDTTPPMSTYLLAFVVGELHAVHGETKNGTRVSVWATPAQRADSLQFALKTAVAATEFFNDFFDTPYPLPKCDHLALPDFSAGAMENWGLITYREICLLVDANTAVSTKEWVATVIAHEISHQWFGNLVTMKWWDDLWLNESFATLMEYVAVDALHPEWDIWMSFTSHEALAALRRDSLPGVQAVRTDVKHPDEISTLFDGAIVYAKGSRLLNMLYRHIGGDAFRRGLKTYFSAHAYGNTVGADLWRALEETSGQPVSDLMNSWLEQPGYPIIYAAQHGDQLDLRQERFLIAATHNPAETVWPVPLLTESASGLHRSLLTAPAGSFTLPSSAPILLNATANGHYTVRYVTAEQQTAVTQHITAGTASPSTRMLLLNDSIMQARAGIGSAVETLQLLEAYRHEAAEPVWDMIALAISDIRRLVEDDEVTESQLKRLVASLVTPQLKRLGWDSANQEPQSDTKLRATLIGLGIYSENTEITKEALQRFKSAGSLQDLPAELRPILFSAAIKHDLDDSFRSLQELHRATANAELQQDIATGLSSTKDPAKAHQLLAQLKNGSVRLQDVSHWVAGLLRNKYTREAAWQWILEEWPWIESNFGNDKSYDNYPRYAANIFATQEWLERYQTFFEPLASQPALTRVIEVGIADITSRVSWKERDAPLLANHLTRINSAK